MWSFFGACDEKSLHIRMNMKHIFFGRTDKTDRSTDRPTERQKTDYGAKMESKKIYSERNN